MEMIDLTVAADYHYVYDEIAGAYELMKTNLAQLR